MPKIIRNGKTYSGIPTEGVTTSTTGSTPPSTIKTLRDTSGTVPFVPETTPSAVKYSNGNSLETTIGSIAKIEGTTASRNFSKGEYIVRNGQLYIVSVSVLSGETWTVGTNIDSTSVGAELSSLNSNKGYVKDINISVAANSTEYVSVSSLFDSDGLYFVSFVDYTGLAINNGPIAIINVFNNKNNIVTFFTARGREYWNGVVTIENVIGTVYEELVIKNSSTIEAWSVTKMSLKPLEVR